MREMSHMQAVRCGAAVQECDLRHPCSPTLTLIVLPPGTGVVWAQQRETQNLQLGRRRCGHHVGVACVPREVREL